MKSRGNDRKHSKIKTEPLRLLGCPFRKRYPLGFNIRDAQQCCEGFANVPDVVCVPPMPSPLQGSMTPVADDPLSETTFAPSTIV